jgi:RNA polymerase sigma-70 factor (ECF subfamily)
MAAVARGDRSAFAALVERHHDRALNLAYRLCGDREMARDVVQESFLALLRGASRYRAQSRFDFYLFAVVRNAVRGAARARNRRREDPLPDGPDGVDVPDSRRPDTELAQHRLRERLHRALAALPVEMREVFVLSEIEGIPYQEIARICGCPMGTVASRKHAAVLKLREMLRDMKEDR